MASKVTMDCKSVEILFVGNTSLPLEYVTFLVHYLLWKFLIGDSHSTSIGFYLSFKSGEHGTCTKYRNVYNTI